MDAGTTQTHRPASWRDLFIRSATWAAVIAFAISGLLHLGGALVSRYVLIGGGGDWGPAGDDRPVEMAIMTEGELAAMLGEATVDALAPAVPDVDMVSPDPTDLMGDGPGGDLNDSFELGAVGSGGGGGDIAGDGLGGLGAGGGGGGGGARFFGVEAQGNRFAYIVDISESMEGPRIAALKQELQRSVDRLLESSQFLVVLYSTEAALLGRRGTWTEASVGGKRWAQTHIREIDSTGATNPLPAFQIVFGTRPRPDAIYFMTDGEFAANVVDEVAILNKQLKIPVHCICFGSSDGEALMKQLAKQSRGTYTFIPGP